MNSATITAKGSAVLNGDVSARLYRFDSERYLLSVDAPSVHWDIHLDKAGVENLKALLASVTI